MAGAQNNGGGGGCAAAADAAEVVMSPVHTIYPLAFFSNHESCDTTVCAMRAALSHSRHDYIALPEASGATRQEIEAAVGIFAAVGETCWADYRSVKVHGGTVADIWVANAVHSAARPPPLPVNRGLNFSPATVTARISELFQNGINDDVGPACELTFGSAHLRMQFVKCAFAFDASDSVVDLDAYLPTSARIVSAKPPLLTDDDLLE